MHLFKNAQFISCEEQNRVFSVMVTEGGRIIHCGDTPPEKTTGATWTDLQGQCVVPAFGDTHIHFSSFSLFHAGLDCREAADFSELADLIVAYAGKHPRRKTLLGFGCSAHSVKERRLPVRATLDGVTSRPLLIVKYDGHGAVANGALIDKLPRHVTAARGYRKDTGWFYQDAFFILIDHVTRAVSPVDVFGNLIGGADFMAGRGIGLIHTVEGVGFPMDMDVDMMRFAARGLPQEFRIYFQTMDVRKALRRKMPRIGGCFATALDGCFGSEDAALREPYSNNEANKGVLYYPTEQVIGFAKRANRAGLQVELHAIGDAAVEQALTAYDAALKDFPREDHRHVIIHACLMDREQIERAARLGIHVALQTPFLHWNLEPGTYIESLIGTRIRNLSPLKTMLDAGLTPANGSDAPCTVPDPVFGIWAACNHPDPSESVSVIDALRMHTSWAARLSFDEKDRGTLTEGKWADFTVLDRNPLETPSCDLHKIRVRDLFLKGKRYVAPPSGPISLALSCLHGR